MGAPRWTIRNYNVFIREARAEWDLSLSEARQLYREVREWKAAPVYGADVDRYDDYLASQSGAALDSVLYDLDVVPPPMPPDAYPDDYMLDAGAEIEFTATTYKRDES